MNWQDIHEELERIVREVKRDNYIDDEIELLRTVVRECASRASLGLLRIGNKPVIAVTGVYNDDFAVVYLYAEIFKDDSSGLLGFGYAYNLSAPEFSEFGYLWTPRTPEEEAN